jgi:hypothetical protein
MDDARRNFFVFNKVVFEKRLGQLGQRDSGQTRMENGNCNQKTKIRRFRFLKKRWDSWGQRDGPTPGVWTWTLADKAGEKFCHDHRQNSPR